MRKLLSLLLSKLTFRASPHPIEEEKLPSFLYSKEALEELRKVFPQRRWEEHRTLEELAYNAGQQHVIDHIERRLHKAGPNMQVINAQN